LGAAVGLRASFTATIQGSVRAAFGSAREAYNAHQRVMELDKGRRDAGLIVGTYRYLIAGMTLPMRWVAYAAGFGGGREKGLTLVKEAADYAGDNRVDARVALVLLYNREKRYDDALRVIGDLQRRFPRNRLLWLEAGGTALRAGRPAEARRAIEDGLVRLARDERPRAPGEDARWHYTYGAILAALKDHVRAEHELNTALTGATRDWLRGRIRKELGKLADGAGNRARALDELALAERLCRQDHDNTCADEARSFARDVKRKG
jgi:tetratricopeptide (TPR) repeat protein